LLAYLRNYTGFDFVTDYFRLTISAGLNIKTAAIPVGFVGVLRAFFRNGHSWRLSWAQNYQAGGNNLKSSAD
jgi:hypothetical protein